MKKFKPKPVPEKKLEPVRAKDMEPEPVPENKQDTSKEAGPAGIEKSKKGDENIPEWKKKLEERRAARMKEQDNIQFSAEVAVCVCVCVCGVYMCVDIVL